MADDDVKPGTERVHRESIEGAEFRYPDGTVVVNGEVVKAGSRAIVEGGKLLAFRPE